MAVFQKRLTPQESQAAWQEVENDLGTGLLVPRGGLWHRILQEAESIAQNHTPAVGSRTLDIIHVATAKLLSTPEFYSFDTRQAALARRVGLTITGPAAATRAPWRKGKHGGGDSTKNRLVVWQSVGLTRSRSDPFTFRPVHVQTRSRS